MCTQTEARNELAMLPWTSTDKQTLRLPLADMRRITETEKPECVWACLVCEMCFDNVDRFVISTAGQFQMSATAEPGERAACTDAQIQRRVRV